MNRIDYSKIDPVLKNQPDISWQEFKEIAKKKKIKCSNWCFNARKKKIKGESGYGVNKADSFNASSFIKNLFPKSKKRKELERIVSILIDNPDTSYSAIKAKSNISDCYFYNLRRALKRELNSSVGPKVSNKKSKTALKKNSGMFVNIFEKEIDGKGISSETAELLGELVEALKREKIANLEIVETVYPKRAIEIRSFARM